mmetsp:Transcript_5965/g.15857  ORF Transcript_5965/g.15857 Transcript_5965/m.15857 type:complete len:255 (-) Transcript_5965:2007-2771(-)
MSRSTALTRSPFALISATRASLRLNPSSTSCSSTALSEDCDSQSSVFALSSLPASFIIASRCSSSRRLVSRLPSTILLVLCGTDNAALLPVRSCCTREVRSTRASNTRPFSIASSFFSTRSGHPFDPDVGCGACCCTSATTTCSASMELKKKSVARCSTSSSTSGASSRDGTLCARLFSTATRSQPRTSLVAPSRLRAVNTNASAAAMCNPSTLPSCSFIAESQTPASSLLASTRTKRRGCIAFTTTTRTMRCS